MDSKIILELKDNVANINYEPSLDNATFVTYVNNALNTMPAALLNMFATIPLLRPACERERESHTYVFNDGERGEMENELYKYRKHLYDTTAAVFSQLLSTAFPDIEYIEGCKQYQQDFCMTHGEDEVKEYVESVNEVVTYVRENFEEVLKEVTEDDEQETESDT